MAAFLTVLVLLAPCPLFLPAVADDGAGGAEPALPRFKWAQTREKLFITVVVKDLERNSVSMSFTEDRIRFNGSDSWGKAFALDVELAHDIESKAGRWEHLQRPDRWGDAVLALLPKKFPGRWDALAQDPKRYRKVMDRDWSREDEKLEPLEEDTYLTEHRKYAPLLLGARLEKARAGVEALVVNVRHKECSQCTVADDTFAKVAKQLADTKHAPLWHSRLRLVIVDAVRERRLARMLGAFCSPEPKQCRHFVLAYGGGNESMRLRARHDALPLLADLERLGRKQFRPTSATTTDGGRTNETRALIVLGPAANLEAHSAAHRLRLQADIQLTDAPEAKGIAIWSPMADEPEFYDGSSHSLGPWLRARALPPLGNTSQFEDEEPYEELGLPIARLFLDGNAADVAARATVHDLAQEFVGRIAFMARNATTKSHEWRQHGLPSRSFPAFGVAQSMVHNATKYAFLDMPRNSTSDSDIAFWSGPAKNLLRGFLEDMFNNRLAGCLPSERPPEQEFAWGAVRILVGRTCKDVVESSEGEVLIEAFDEWRRDHANRTRHLDVLALILARWNITTYRLDLGYNECPRETLPLISAGYSGYFFVPRMTKGRKKSPLERMKKLDPSFASLLKYIAKQSAGNISKSVPIIQKELEDAIALIDKQESIQDLWKNGLSGLKSKYLCAALLGFAGLLAFYRLQRSKVPQEMGPLLPPNEEPEANGAAPSGVS